MKSVFNQLIGFLFGETKVVLDRVYDGFFGEGHGTVLLWGRISVYREGYISTKIEINETALFCQGIKMVAKKNK
ncbi:MAG: hypothetical protein ISS66_01010 [Desulfobacteraceae bacterium]|nr:hypothetical protein [Desulfobacteraceae bacterium]